MQDIEAVFFAFLMTLLLVQVLKRPAVRWGLVDVPGGRKTHERPVPIVGGIAMCCAFVLAFMLFGPPLYDHRSLLGMMLVVTAFGAMDDYRDLSARTKFVGQIIAAVLICSWGGVYLSSLGNLFGDGEVLLGIWAIPFTVFSIIGVMNAVNMADGVDGLAGGLTLSAVFWFGLSSWISGDMNEILLLFLLGGVVLGFLCFNMRSPWHQCASVFMGDSGSLFLGFALAWLAVNLTNGPGHRLSPITAVWILGLPLMDTVSIMIRRIIKGRNPFSADREHLHHIFLAAGFSVNQAVPIILFVSVLFGGIGVAGWYYKVSERVMLYAFLAVFAGHYVVVGYSWRVMKVIRALRIAVFGERQEEGGNLNISRVGHGAEYSEMQTSVHVQLDAPAVEEHSNRLARMDTILPRRRTSTSKRRD